MRLLVLWLLFLLPSAGVLGQTSDVTPAQVVSVTLTPSSVDVAAEPQLVTVRMHLTDDLSGVMETYVALGSPSRAQIMYAWNSCLRVGGGVPQDDIWEGTIQIPQFAESGDWTLFWIRLVDQTGNSAYYYDHQLRDLGITATVQVASTPDITAPVLRSFRFVPAVFDVSGADQELTLEFGLTDDLAGILAEALYLFVQSPTGRQRRGLWYAFPTLISGDANNGVWRTTVNIPRYTEPGLWTVEYFDVRDRAGNRRILNGQQIADLGDPSVFASTFEVQSSPSDTTAPLLQNFSFSPTFIDTSVGPVQVAVTLDASDDLSGITFKNNPVFPYGWVVFRSPSGAQTVAVPWYENHLEVPPVAGSPTNGTWQLQAHFPQFSEEGVWRVGSIVLKDVTHNYVITSSTELEAMGAPTKLTVVRPSLQVDGSITDPTTGGTIEDQVFGANAAISFPPGVLTSPTDVSIDVLQSPISVDLPSGFSSEGSYYVNLSLSPHPTSFASPGISLVLPLVQPLSPGLAIVLYRIDPATGDLVPAVSVTGGWVVGTVAPDGLSVSFSGIASLSTVVGLLPDPITVGILVKPGSETPVLSESVRGWVPIAILGSTEVSVGDVDPATVSSSLGSPRLRPNGVVAFSVEDVNADGLLDMLLHLICRGWTTT